MQKIKNFFNRLSFHFDRSFSQSYKKQLLWLASLMVLVIFVLWLLGHFRALYNPDSFSEKSLFFEVLFLLFDPGSISDGMSYAYVTIVALCGIIVFCGLFISVITNMLGRRVELFEAGELHYNLQNHVVIIGFDRTVPALIHYICKNEELSDSMILLQTSEDVVELRKVLANELSKDEEKRLVFYSGYPTLEEDLRKLQLDQCVQIYIVGPDAEAHDAICMDCLEKVASIVPEPVEGTLAKPCYVQFASLESYDLLQYAELKPSIRERLRFFPYNFEQVWAHRILIDNCDGSSSAVSTAYLPIDSVQGINAGSAKHVRVVVVGMNAMGIAMAESAAHIAHFPNFRPDDMRSHTIITFIDKDIHGKMLRMKARLSGLFDVSYSRYMDGSADPQQVEWGDSLGSDQLSYLGPNFMDTAWEFVEGDTSSPFVRKYLESLAADEDALVSLIFADSDSERALSAATQLPHLLYESDSVLQILLRQDENSSYVRLLGTANDSKFAKLKAFGQLDGFFSRRMIPEEFGKMVNACYGGDVFNRQSVEANWKAAPTANQWSSMRSANMRFVRMRSIGYDMASADYDRLRQLMAEHESEMMNVEHNRWNQEKLLSGFRPLTNVEAAYIEQLSGDERKKAFKCKKNAPYFAHLDICSLERLNKVDKPAVDYDRDVLQKIPDMLKAEALYD